MSDGPIALLAPADLQFVAVPSDFAGLVAESLGSLGTEHDGFDAVFNEAAALAIDAGNVLASFDSDLTDAGLSVPAFDNSAAAAMAAELQPAADATDSALNDYNSTLAGSGGSGGGGGGGIGIEPGSGGAEKVIGTPNNTGAASSPLDPVALALDWGNQTYGSGEVNGPLPASRITGDPNSYSVTAAQILAASPGVLKIDLSLNGVPIDLTAPLQLNLHLSTNQRGYFSGLIAAQIDNGPQWFNISIKMYVA